MKSLSYSVGEGRLIEDSVVLPGCALAKRFDCGAPVNKHCRFADGFRARLDVAHDRERGFHVTTNGVTLIVPGMLDQQTQRILEIVRKLVYC